MPSIALGLLESAEDHGYPTDYLLSRVRGRRSRLAREWGRVLSAPPGRGGMAPMESFENEAAWIYRQMNRPLRALLAPVFEILELRAWILALRLIAAGEESTLAALLAPSLLARRIKALLLSSRGLPAALAASERVLAEADPVFAGLGALYRSQGPGGLEEGIMNRALLRALERPLHDVTRSFFQELVDIRNLLGLYKHLHWQLAIPPPLLEGGRVTPRRLEGLWQERSIPALVSCARDWAGDPAARGSLEKILLDGFSRHLRRAASDPLGPGVILDHLWFCTTRQRNLRLLSRMAARGGSTLAEELLA